MPGFRSQKYTGVTRSLRELAQYAAVISLSGPSVIVPVLPLPTPYTAAAPPPLGAPESELPGLALALARWFDRVYSEKPLRKHPETRRFIEADYTYEPERPPAHAPAGAQKQFATALSQVTSLDPVLSGAVLGGRGNKAVSGRRMLSTPAGLASVNLVTSSLTGTSDPDEQLALARGEITRLEKQLSDVHAACTEVTSTRTELARAMREVAEQLPSLATLEEVRGASVHGNLPRSIRSASATLVKAADAEDEQSPSDCVLGGALEYQSLNMRAARQALQERTAIIAEHAIARRVVETKTSDANTQRMSRYTRPERVDAAVAEASEAQAHEAALSQYLERISTSLRASLQRHSRGAHHDLQSAISEHVRISEENQKRIREILVQGYKEVNAVQEVNTPRISRKKRTPAQVGAALAAGHDVEAEAAEAEAAEAEAAKAESAKAEAEAATERTVNDDAVAEINTQTRTENAANFAPGEPHTGTEPEPEPATDEQHDEQTRVPQPESQSTKPTGPSVLPQPFHVPRTGGMWKRLSASDAAKTLGGTF